MKERCIIEAHKGADVYVQMWHDVELPLVVGSTQYTELLAAFKARARTCGKQLPKNASLRARRSYLAVGS